MVHVVVAYDVGDAKIRRKLFKWLEEKGIHSQKSVFECKMDAVVLHKFKVFLAALELAENDAIVIYPLCEHCADNCITLGTGNKIINSPWLII